MAQYKTLIYWPDELPNVPGVLLGVHEQGREAYVDFQPDWGTRRIVNGVFAQARVKRHTAFEVGNLGTRSASSRAHSDRSSPMKRIALKRRVDEIGRKKAPVVANAL